MNENGQNGNGQQYSYSGNQGQVFAPAPERHQTTTYVDGMNVGNRYVNNEYMSNNPYAPANSGNTGVNLSDEIARKAEAERLAAEEAAKKAAAAQQAAARQQEVPVQAAPVQPEVPVQPAVSAEQSAALEMPAATPVAPAETPMTQASAPAAQAQPTAPAYTNSTIPPQAMQRTATPEQPAKPVLQETGKSGKTKEEKNEKKKPFGIRLLMAAAFGLAFGAVAGGVILLMIRFIPNRLIGGISNPSSEVTTESSELPSMVPVEPSSEAGGTITNITNPNAEIGATEVNEEMTVPEVAEACMPSIVIINSKVDYNYYGYITEATGSGTGVIVGQNDDDLFIATNYHVVKDAKEITIQFCDSSTAKAEIKGKKATTDLAVVTVSMSSLGESTKNAIKLAKIGTSSDLVVGESCVAIGNALGYGQSVTTGVISALDREMVTESGEKGVFIQTDAAINHGNSGGALLNMRGEVIGINSARLDGSTVEGMGYAIPIDTARPIIEKLIEKEKLEVLPEDEQSYFGISGYTVKSGNYTQNGVIIPTGIYIKSVAPGSPAEKCGLRPGDILIEFEGESVVSTQEFMELLASYPSGSEVTITYRRLENDSFNTYETKVVLESKDAQQTR